MTDCPTCGYLMDIHDTVCPKCAHLSLTPEDVQEVAPFALDVDDDNDDEAEALPLIMGVPQFVPVPAKVIPAKSGAAFRKSPAHLNAYQNKHMLAYAFKV